MKKHPAHIDISNSNNKTIKESYHEINRGHGGTDPKIASNYLQDSNAKMRLLFWETTAGCNLECVHCRRLDVSRKLMESDLNFEEAKQLVDQIVSVGKPIFVLSGGEPLMRPDIFDIADYATKSGLTVAMATNGTMITSEVAKKIKSSGIQRVSVSLDGATADIHDKFRKLDGSFDRAIEGIKHVQDVNVSTQINSTIAKHNVHQVKDLYRNAIDLKCDALHIFMLVPVGCGVEIEKDQSLDALTYEKVLNWFYEVSLERKIETKATCAPHYFRIMRERAKADNIEVTTKTHGMAAMTKGCLAGQSICFVSHKGEIFPCGYFPLEVGNVKHDNLTDVWSNSEVFQKLRNQENLTGKCGACDYKEVCEGCRARAYFYTDGDYLSEEPYCIYEPPAWQVAKVGEDLKIIKK
ncbi:MAG: radical SAM protein [Nitrospinota bacterium]